MTTSWLQIAGYSIGFALFVLFLAGSLLVMAAIDWHKK